MSSPRRLSSAVSLLVKTGVPRSQGGGSLPGDGTFDGREMATASDAVCFQTGDGEAGLFDGDET